MSSALTDPLQSPAWAQVTPEAIEQALDQVLGDREAVVDGLAAGEGGDFASVWMPLERANTAISALWSTVSHLRAVADSQDLRAAHRAGMARLTAHNTQILQNRGLYDRLAALNEGGRAALSAADQMTLRNSLRDFSQAGVGLEPAQRARFGEISLELSALSTDFAGAVLDATDAWSELVTDEALLEGLPGPARAMLAANATAKGLSGWLVTLQQPSVMAILTFAKDRALRERVYYANGVRASDQGADAGKFDNTDRILRILELRREAAALLGFENPVARSLSTKMAPDSETVLAFLRDLAARARPGAERDLAILRDYATQTLGLEALEPWDLLYVGAQVRQARHDLDEQEIRAYFPVERVLAGWRKLLTKLFGITLVERADAETWHPDARFFDVVDADGSVFAGVYLDLHARAGKQGGAWMAEARPRLRDDARQRNPIAFLTCNFAPLVEGAPSLLSHDDVLTLLHETGHCLHLLFTQVDRPSIAGTNGFEWDAVELPSQLMEDFAWDYDVLASMSAHWQTGAPLPRALYDRMVQARHFQGGLLILRQVEMALFDLLLHLSPPGTDPMAVLADVRDEVALIKPPAWHRFPHAFLHIFHYDYAAGYYSYLWAEVLAADAYARFVEAGGADRQTGELLRRELLSKGATRPAAESFRAFRGREPDLAAMLVRRGLVN
ncbi:M3 family metallopeptidase [Caulobacter sp.]|uniref:M3 family metallopeptidase n=1 Tax=Caulobacter sp. TaxID=78 RepID=UPI0031E11C99